MEQVVEFDLGVRWEPNAPAPILIQDENDSYLILAPHFDDPDRTPVVLRWIGCQGALLGPPDDEARSGHRLWDRGLRGCLWAAEVTNSRWIDDLEEQNRVHTRHQPKRYDGLRHFILLFHDSTFEVLAQGVQATREDFASLAERLLLGRH